VHDDVLSYGSENKLFYFLYFIGGRRRREQSREEVPEADQAQRHRREEHQEPERGQVRARVRRRSSLQEDF
jgi:hypothetical protein